MNHQRILICLGLSFLAAGLLFGEDADITFTAGDAWKAVDMSDVQVKAGSALDFSAQVEAGPAGKHGRVILGKIGGVAFADAPDKEVRFFGYNSIVTHYFGTSPGTLEGKTADETKANIKLYAQLIKRQGYNLLRTLCLDTHLMVGSETDGEFNAARLDVYEYLFACLKEEGIYLYLDLGGYGLYFQGSWDEKVVKRGMKTEMYVGHPPTRENWKNGVIKLLTRVNPYTKTRLLDDPAVVCLNFYNEQELGLIRPKGESAKMLEVLWRGWLKKKYASLAEAVAAWDKPEFAKLGSLDEVPFSDPWNATKFGNDYGAFLQDYDIENLAWYVAFIKSLGYTGLYTQYDINATFRYGVIRADLPLMSMHGYHAHSSSAMNPGSVVDNASSVANAGWYWRYMAASRMTGKPFFITEHCHGFWNAYQHEDGLLFSAYSSFQNFSCVLVHENAVWLNVKESMKDFSVGRSPVGRANEFLAACLYGRGDVAKAVNRVELRVDQDYLKANLTRTVNGEQNKVALLTGLDLKFPGSRAAPTPASMLMAPADGASMTSTEWAATMVDSKTGSFSMAKAAGEMRSRGILPKNNLTDPAQGIFQNETGEILLNTNERKLSVITGRTEGVTLNAGHSAQLSVLKIENLNVDACVALTSIDGSALRDSRRLVLVFNTDTVNSGMQVSGDRKTLRKPGTLPALMRTGVLKVSFQNPNAASLKAWALGFDGSRRQQIPLKASGKNVLLSLDTASLEAGPTPFFEIAAN
ncbi:MAG: hypothetical protein JNM63_14390 [Spirochaetia bacterium]|nr:hypothetical protein [Spirochaetia bacterium]